MHRDKIIDLIAEKIYIFCQIHIAVGHKVQGGSPFRHKYTVANRRIFSKLRIATAKLIRERHTIHNSGETHPNKTNSNECHSYENRYGETRSNETHVSENRGIRRFLLLFRGEPPANRSERLSFLFDGLFLLYRLRIVKKASSQGIKYV